MRLSTIKLAGFKSFVEPTTIRLPNDLTGVVGPNGCGKSNVIDAVRWVTGESSARQLRGEALEDVIFAGSKSRQPVGRASVELVFDNANGTLGGPYAGFGEIVVRREQSRQAGSRYFINGNRARRRDVVDLFLGTGLGGRNSYAIIGQGTVNRLIDARPEQIRDVLEETAGISKYKERRRETENRIHHTRDNLERLAERIAAADERVASLGQQAETAKTYRELAAEQRRLQRGRLTLRWVHWRDRAAAAEAQCTAARASQTAAIARQRDAEGERRECERRRKQAARAVEARQAAYYDAQAESQRVAQAVDHADELRRREQRERDELSVRRDELEARHDIEASAERDAATRLSKLEARLTTAAADEDNAAQALGAADDAVAEAEANRDALAEADDNPVLTLERERQRVADAEKTITALDEQRAARRNERDALGGRDAAELDAAGQALAARADQLERDRRRRDRQAAHLELQKAALAEAERALSQYQTRLAEIRAEWAGEKTFARELAGRDDAIDWLGRHCGAGAVPVSERVEVRGDWQHAADVALGDWLAARAVARWPDLGAAESCPAPLRLIVDEPPSAGAGGETRAGAPSLAAGLRAPAAIQALAQKFFVTATIADAEAGRGELAADEWFVTRDGVCLGASCAVLPVAGDREAGPLAHARRVRDLEHRLSAEQAAEQAATATRAARREVCGRAIDCLGRLDDALAAEQRALATAGAEHEGERQRAEQARRRADELAAELADLDTRIERTRTERSEAERCLGALGERAERFAEDRHARQQTLIEARDKRDAARVALADAETARRDIEAEQAQVRAERDRAAERCADIRRALDAVAGQFKALGNRPAEGCAEAPSTADLEAARAVFAEAETGLRAARKTLSEAEAALEAANQAGLQAESKAEAAREALQRASVDRESASARRDSVAEQLAEVAPDATPAALAAALPDDADADRWQAELDDVSARIEALGAINLAAIDEYETECEQARYLREQYQDMNDALATLTTAIGKIDRETRAQFKAVFDEVNARFAERFTELFGGGEARLEGTDNDWLAAGVRVLARPPGKPRVALSMLSGGEKALTAIALLFALFERNPAPFCMLDEIDAALDDVNVGRFCELLRRMSVQVQFIVITHNKVTMELPAQLHGVTMAESGVSRLVSVDVDAALDLAG